MAGLEPLIPHIYHEKQQPGSMLCAQHALNSLLQGNYFTAPDLSDIARNLDSLEQSYDDSNMGHSSTNMDDTGFFSVQVLDNALRVWGLNLTRWRGENMRPYHNHPHTQLAFILNLEQHWFTLRRFGNANANVDLDDGNGHWFNLNSFLPAPQWVGKLYLGMVLQQAESEGYSVFAVTQADPAAPLALPRTEADVISSTLPEPSSSVTDFESSFVGSSKSLGKMNAINPTEASTDDIDIEDEDYELQAALQASLMGRNLDGGPEEHSPSPPPPIPSTVSHSWSQSPLLSPPARPDSRSYIPQLVQRGEASVSLPGHADLDPVTASMERNRVLLQRMKEQQEYAQREMWSDSDLAPEEQAALDERRERRRRQEEEAEAELLRAIEESEALAKQQRLERGVNPRIYEGTAVNPPSTSTSQDDHIHFDDEDAELQAALKASLEHAGLSHSQPPEVDDAESIVSDTTSTDATVDQPSEAPSLEEIRKRRLARFGL
ncbi:Josephin-domain-containing protein [Flammula alnicola]|nr:Josephin-domain-containing protein [Flammula alnicola]